MIGPSRNTDRHHSGMLIDFIGIPKNTEAGTKLRTVPTENLVLAHYGSRRAHVTQPLLHLVDFKCASKFWQGTTSHPPPASSRVFFLCYSEISASDSP